MSLLHGKDTETTTLLGVIQAAEASEQNAFEVIRLELDSGREMILLAAVGDDLDATGRVLEALQDLQEVR
ncbi:TPA: hypothetical protein ACUL4Z_000797 [Pseudomonas aeruginosa]|uniref:hypothetical protein n=1 Tax=Pseudomonadaceae TaxID=135621 RepID=UPI000357C913|nr:hypothetical protein [Pseudomonas aeruginosa]EPL63692.1 hypothetical protein B382_04405 [Stutzerimonas stutzeri B1SMN1]ELJ2355638.1 hypothetical protein [Pseudomonas aeruginosa]HBO5745770.1 hypothetical protein [Pseudomonas aeruginosa]HBO5782085.1 hypothetical protein [Pseudomonas aeruginosa]HBO6016773.1 hypothetical protein [Pseudomonas aeruginosa]